MRTVSFFPSVAVSLRKIAGGQSMADVQNSLPFLQLQYLLYVLSVRMQEFDGRSGEPQRTGSFNRKANLCNP